MQLALTLLFLGSGAAQADEAKGATLYQANCSTCHGAALDGMVLQVRLSTTTG